MGWQPIETAPLDGTEIDLWVRQEGWLNWERVANCYWIAHKHRFECASYPCVIKKRYASHWMPLPEPPNG